MYYDEGDIMEYCPYCAEQLVKPVKICPNCKKSLDVEILKDLYKPGDTTKVNTKIKRRIWFKEHTYILYPIFSCMVGFLLGAIILYSYAQVQFLNDRSDQSQEITDYLLRVIECFKRIF